MTQAVTELVVDGSGALSVLGQYERGMERAGLSTERSTGALSRFDAAMQRAREAQEKGLAIQTESIQRRSAEQRALERWQGHVDKTMRRELQLRREAERAAVDMSNAVVLGYTTQEQATATLIALEQRHAAELRQLAGATNAAGAANDNLRTRVDAATRSMQRQRAAAGAGTFQTANIAAQFQDIAVTSAMGMSPLQIALQQGTQLSAILNTMDKPVRGLAAAFMSVINPVSLVTIAVIAAGAALIQYFSSGEKEVDKIDAALKAHADNIADIKARWGDAASGVTEYVAKSRDLVKFETLIAGDNLEQQLQLVAQGLLDGGDLIRTQAREIQDDLERLEQAFVLETDQATLEGMYVEIQRLSQALQNASNEVLVAGDRFGPFKRELDAFAESVRAGTPDFIRLQDAIARRGLADPANAELKRLANEINALIGKGPDLQRSLEGNATALDKISVSARGGAKDIDDFAAAMERLNKLAAVPLSDRQSAAADLEIALKRAAGWDDALVAIEAYEAALKRIENREAGAAVPIPTPRPNDIQRLDWEDEALDKQASAYDRVVESARNRIEQMQLEIEVVGKAGIEADALRLQLDLLQKAQKDGATVTPEQRAEIEKLTASYRELATELAKLQALDEIDFARSLIGLSDGDKQIVSALRQWGLDANTEQGRVVAGQLRVNQVMQETQDELKAMQDIGKDAFMSILDLLYETGDIGDKLIGIFANIGKEFAKLGMEKLWKSFTGEGASIFDVPAARTPTASPSPVQTQQIGREIGNAIAPSITSSLNENLTSFAAAIRKIESGSYEGNYGARGKVLTSGSYAGDRAYGAYQVMGKNIASWTKEVLGHSLTISEFVADRAAQDAVFYKKFGASVEKFGTFADGASVWFSGRPLSRAGNSSDGYNTVPQYVQKAQNALDNYPGGLKGGVSDGMVDANRRIAISAQTAADAATAGNAGGGLQNLLGGNMQSLMGMAGAFAGGLQSGDPLGGALGGGLSMLGAGAGPLGIIGGAVLGLIGGLIGRARQKRQELKQAQQELEQQMGAITELIATATGNFMGTFEKTVMQAADEFSKAIAMANKAKNQELVDELTAAQDEFFSRMTDRWENGFAGMLASMNAGLALDSEYMSGMDSVEKMREQLVGFVNDARLFADAQGDLASVIKNRKARFQEEEKMYEYQAEYSGGRADAGTLTIQNALVEGYRAIGDQIIKFGVQAYNSTGAALYDTLADLKAAAVANGLIIDEMGVVAEAAADPNADLADRVRQAQEAAQATALAMLSGAEEFTAMEEAVQRLNGTAANMKTLLMDLGMSAEEAGDAIAEHLVIGFRKMRQALVEEMQASINDLAGFGFLNDLFDAQETFSNRLRDLGELGMSSDLALQELALRVRQIGDDAGLTDDQLRQLAGVFPVISEEILALVGVGGGGLGDARAALDQAKADLRAAYDEEKRTIEQLIGRMENLKSSLTAFLDSLRLDANLSPLDPFQRLQEVQQQFQKTAALALTGDAEALGKIEDVSRDYLNEAKAYYASSEAYFQIFGEVEGVLNQALAVADQQLTEAEQQLARLDQQVAGLIDIDNSVMSVAEAIAALNEAQTAYDAYQTSLFEQMLIALEGTLAERLGNTGTGTGTSAQVEALYRNVLGRAPDAAGASFWQSLIGSGGLTTDIYAMFAKAARDRGETVLPGYAGGTDFHPGGLAWVGERGRELVNLPRGAQVFPHETSMSMMRAGNDNSALLAEVKALRQQVASLEGEMGRNTQVTAAGTQVQVAATEGTTRAVTRQAQDNRRAQFRRTGWSMTLASEWLVELQAHDGDDVVTLRYSSCGYTTGPADTPANTVYENRIQSIGAFSQHLFTQGRTMGEASVEMSDLTLSNADGKLNALKNYAVDGRPFVLKRLASRMAPHSSAETVLTGTMEGIDASGGSLSLLVRFYDRRRDLDVPLQEDRYEGTTTEPGATAEGSVDLKDRLKPLAFGLNYSVPSIIVNDFNMFLQFSASALVSIVLYDGGVPLIDDGDVATIEELAAATGNPGHYKTCLALGLARPFGTFNGRPAFTWTADIVEGATAADRRAAAIVERMLERIGLDGEHINAATFAALNSLATAELGIYIDNDVTVLSGAYEVLRSVGGFIMPNHLGQFEVGRLDEPGEPEGEILEPEILTASKDETLSFISNPDTDGAVPAHRILIKHRRNWHVHTDSDLGHCANFGDPTRGSALKQQWREARVEDAAIIARHLLSQEMELETAHQVTADAEAEGARRLGLYGIDRDVVRVSVDAANATDMLPGTTWSLVVDWFDYGEGVPMRIIGRDDMFDDDQVVLTLWG